MAFYDALTKPEHITDFYKNDQLIALTKELTEMLRRNRTIDWQKKETARASMRKMVKHLLKKYKYPSEDYDTAISTVIVEIFISVIRSMWRGGDHAKADI